MTLAVLALVLAQSAAPPQEAPYQPPNLMKRIVGLPTGHNGYEEYLTAAEESSLPSVAAALKTVNETKAGSDNWLAARKALVAQGGSIRRWIVQGNAKDVVEPRKSMNMDTLFPEYSYFKSVARLLPAQATVEFSEGHNVQGADTLFAGLVFGEKVSRTGLLIAYLVAMACQSITLTGYQANLERIPLGSWKQVVRQCDLVLKSDALSRVVHQELVFAATNLDTVLSHPKQGLFLGEDLDPDTKDMVDRITNLTAPQKADIKARILRAMDSYSRLVAAVLAKPETTWASSFPGLANTWQQERDPLVNWLCNAILPIFDQVYVAEMKKRAQARLLKLHGLIQCHRWETGTYPKELKELGDEAACHDPLSGEQFVYVLGTTDYELYSKGGAGLTRIDLVYKRPKSSPNDEGPIGP